jgi:hypothetical protein
VWGLEMATCRLGDGCAGIMAILDQQTAGGRC